MRFFRFDSAPHVQVLVWIIVFCVGAVAPLWAQGDDEDEPDLLTASLFVRYDSSGRAQVHFFTGQEVTDWAPLESALGNALHCAAGSLKHPQARALPEKYLEVLSTSQRQNVGRQVAQQSAGSLEGTCFSTLTRNQFVLSTELSFKNVLTELQKVGGQQLLVTIDFPAAKFLEFTPGLPQFQQSGLQRAGYLFKTDAGDAAVVRLAFGYQNKDVYRAIAFPAAFLLLPFLIVLWMQRAALRGAKDDPTAAWFSYVRVLNACILMTTAFWMVSRSLRQALDELIAYSQPGSSATAAAFRVAILLAPPWIIYLLCLLSSHRVYVHVRGLTWSRKEFYAAQISQVATQALPLMCLVGGLELLNVNFRWAMGLLASSYFVLMLCARLQLKITGTHPEALTVGELRDQVFALAKSAATELRQVFVMPAGKAQMANAFASSNKTVIFTDYLLARLTRREVTAIAAHEITHLQKAHTSWKAVGFVGLIFSPMLLRGITNLVVDVLVTPMSISPDSGSIQLASTLRRITSFPELDLVYFLIGLTLYYLQSRVIENSADAGAVQLTGDPEALMTGLLKLGRLNLMPIQWGRVAGTLLTHPSTLKRVERIGRIGQVSPVRIQEIVVQYQQSTERTDDLPAVAKEETFSEAVAPTQRVTTTARAAELATNKLWVLLFFHIAPAAAIAHMIDLMSLQGTARIAAYIAGAVACVAIYTVIMTWTGVWGRKRLQQQFLAKLQSEGFSLTLPGVLVGLSPDPTPRFYVASYNWDDGYLFAASDGLYFVGDQTRFRLNHNQIRSIRLGPGAPYWLHVPRIYIDWWDESQSAVRTYNLAPMRPCSFWKLRIEAVALEQWLGTWMANPNTFPPAATPLAALKPPSIGEVTSRSIKTLHTGSRAFSVDFWIVALAALTSTFLGASTVYVCGVVLLLRLFEHLPAWWAKEQLPTAAQPSAAKAVSANH